MNKAKFILAGLFFTILGLIIVNITLNNMMSTQGIVFDQLQTNLQSLQKENIVIEDKVLHLSSYTRIASQAATIGFIPGTAKTQIALSSSIPFLAYKQ